MRKRGNKMSRKVEKKKERGEKGGKKALISGVIFYHPLPHQVATERIASETLTQLWGD